MQITPKYFTSIISQLSTSAFSDVLPLSQMSSPKMLLDNAIKDHNEM